MQLASIICYVMAALILAKFEYFPFYVTITALSVAASLFFLTLTKPDDTEDTVANKADQKETTLG